MIRSMTGFGHGEVSNDKNQKVTVEMKSVNHRYCDISLKLPKKLAMFEASIRNIMKEYASRGKIDIYVSYEDLSETAVSLHYNQAMAAGNRKSSNKRKTQTKKERNAEQAPTHIVEMKK